MFNYNFMAMSSTVKISSQRELFANDLMPVYKLFQLVEETCSRFREDSELSLLNQQTEGEVEVSDVLFSILKEALRYYTETDGIFNPGILSAIENSGYSQSIEMIKGRELIATASSAPFSKQTTPFQLNPDNQTVILHTKIDLGGIAKGWVIDQAVDLLEPLGYGFINVGGDIRIFGVLPRPLNIGIENPFDSLKIISSIQVLDGAIATSTSMKRRWFVNGINMHHLIDPKTGEPSTSSIASATITAPTATEADVWAKVVLLLGEENGKEWIKNRQVKAVLINKSANIWRGGF
ncbi:MAG: FAD:protein FMN transferase [Bacillota bacterium]|nr:FAD:protein FMN transferase [Bacillota bacterium]